MFALMLQDSGDLIKEFTTLDEALVGLRRLLAHEPRLEPVAAVREYENGRPVGDPVSPGSWNERRDMVSDFDRAHMTSIIKDGNGDWFTAQVLRLCYKADSSNLEKLRLAFPDVVEAFEAWRDGDLGSE